MNRDIIKILIVDDEHLIRSLLKKCIDWSSIGMEVVAEASCSEDAIDLVDKYKPDLVFTDICMSRIDGIEFADFIIKKYPHIKVVAVTGYDDFKYAQRGIKAGIKDYLLKPIDDELLLNTALKIKKEIEEERKSISERVNLKNQLAQNLPFIKERLFNRLIQSNEDIHYLKEQMTYLGIDFSYDKFQVAIIENILKQQYDLKNDAEEVMYNIEVLNAVKGYVETEQYKDVSVFFDINYRIVFINNGQEFSLVRLLEYIKVNILDGCKNYYCIGLGRVKNGIENIGYSYQEAVEALNYRIVAGKNSLIKYEDIEYGSELDENIELRIDDKLKIYLISKSEKKVSEFIDDIFEKGNKLCNMSMSKMKEFCIDYVSVILEALEELDIDAEQAKFNKYNIYEEIFQLETIPDMKELLKNISLDTINIIECYRSKKSNKLIDDINEYLKSNIEDSELSLSKVAQVFFVNPSYLSRVFKKEMEVNFMEYITRLRIDKAIQLLTSTDLKAYEVGEKVGIPDSSYFSTCFKRYTGMSVSEYKKS